MLALQEEASQKTSTITYNLSQILIINIKFKIKFNYQYVALP